MINNFITMRWVYILKCKDNYYYVGQTNRLYRRFWEHINGTGGVNTSIFLPEEVVAIYKVDTIGKFVEYNEYVNKIIDGIWNEKYKLYKLNEFDNEDDEYDNLEIENIITECMMIHNRETWYKIRGGKYVRFDVDYIFPNNKYLKDLPLCHCGLPCDIRKNEDKNYLYFRCAKKNIWDKMKKEFDIESEPCNFFMEYIKDKQFKLDEIKRTEDRKKTLSNLFKTSYWLKNVEIVSNDYSHVCIGGCNTTNNKITYNNEIRNLCYDCFIEKNDELSKKYKIHGECVIKLY